MKNRQRRCVWRKEQLLRRLSGSDHDGVVETRVAVRVEVRNKHMVKNKDGALTS